MPPSDDVTKRMFSLLEKKFHGELEEFYSFAIGILEAAPEQVNNEIRNAMNHMARAIVTSDDSIASVELDKAEGHLERAIRDCLKLCTLHLSKRIKSTLKTVSFAAGYLPRELGVEHQQIENDAIACKIAEKNGNEEVNEMLVMLFIRLKKFEEKIATNFVSATVSINPLQALKIYIRYNWLTTLITFSFGVIAGVTGNIVYQSAFQ